MKQWETDFSRLKISGTGARRGFTMTELVLVFCVVGLIIVGIFTTDRVVRYHIMFNQGSDEIGMIANNMRSLYAGQNAANPANPSGFTAAFEAQLFTQGVFPSEMACVIGGATYACHPWDNSWANGSAQISVLAPAGGNPSEFILEYEDVPADVCSDLLVKDSTPGVDTGLRQINVDGGAVGSSTASPPTLPILPANAAADCPPGATHKIDWYYTLGGQK